MSLVPFDRETFALEFSPPGTEVAYCGLLPDDPRYAEICVRRLADGLYFSQVLLADLPSAARADCARDFRAAILGQLDVQLLFNEVVLLASESGMSVQGLPGVDGARPVSLLLRDRVAFTGTIAGCRSYLANLLIDAR